MKSDKDVLSTLLAACTVMVRAVLRGMLNSFIREIKVRVAEILTPLLAALALYVIVLGMALICFMFIAIGIGHLLATTVAPHMAYLIVAAIFVLLLVVIYVFRRAIFFVPISRFITKLFKI